MNDPERQRFDRAMRPPLAPLTYHEAVTASEFHYGTCTRTIGPRGGVTVHCEVWRRNGATQTWKTRPTEYRIPVKYGIRSYGQLHQSDAANVHPTERCPLNHA